MGTLYLVPTPLGNLEDITLRCLRVLGEVALIASEDTRTTKRLLSHYELNNTPLISYHEHSSPQQQRRILETLAHSDVALVSEAGTPLLSDPGYKLVQRVLREIDEANIAAKIVALPGPSAITTALIASGLPTDQFLFAGFIPRKEKQRVDLFTSLKTITATLIFFEAPHRLTATLADMADVFGARRQIALCRELTKLYEEIWRGTLAEAVDVWQTRDIRGEFTLVLAGAQAKAWTEPDVEQALRLLLTDGQSTKDSVKQVTAESGWSKRAVYALAQSIVDRLN